MSFLRTYQTDADKAAALIDVFHEQEEEHLPGSVYTDKKQLVDERIKDSTDLALMSVDDPRVKAWFEELRKAVKAYMKEFPMSKDIVSDWAMDTPFNIQHYKPGGGYKAWHSERIGDASGIYRHLVFMTYLNTIDEKDAGGTEFFHQKITLQPKAGLTAIWPSDWTYTHRGVPSPTKDKYIVTGWFSFIRKTNEDG